MFRIIAFFSVIFIGTLIASAPMSWVYQQLRSSHDPVILSDIKGTLWTGSASINAPELQPPYSAQNWHWDFHALSLISAKLSWKLNQRSQNIEAQLGVSLFSPASDFHFELLSNIKSLAAINPAFNFVSGKISAELNSFNTATCVDNSGEISLSDIALMGFKLEQLDIEISCSEHGAFELAYQSNDPLTQLKGKLVIEAGGNFKAETSASSKDPATAEQLAALASKKLSRGNYLFIAQGNINQL